MAYSYTIALKLTIVLAVFVEQVNTNTVLISERIEYVQTALAEIGMQIT